MVATKRKCRDKKRDFLNFISFIKTKRTARFLKAAAFVFHLKFIFITEHKISSLGDVAVFAVARCGDRRVVDSVKQVVYMEEYAMRFPRFIGYVQIGEQGGFHFGQPVVAVIVAVS